MMKVSYITSNFPPYIGGGERQAFLLARTLQKQGVEVDVLTGGWINAPRREIMDGVPVKRFGPSKGGKIKSIIVFLNWLFYVAIRGQRYHVFHAHQPYSAVWVALTGKLLWGARVVIKIRGTTEIEYLKNAKIKLSIIKNFSDKVVVLNKDHVKQLIEMEIPSTKIVLIPNGVDINTFSALHNTVESKSIENAVIFLGRLIYLKGVDVLLRAWKLVEKKSQIAPSLYIIGDGPERNKLEKQAADAGLKKIRFLGALEHSSLKCYLIPSNIFVSPSRPGQEGLSNALLEAMTVGMGIIATNVEGTRDIIHHETNGLLVMPESAEMLASAIIHLLNNPVLRDKLGQSALQTIVTSYSIRTIANRYNSLYSRLVINS